MTNAIAIRKKVAELCGFTDVAVTSKRLQQMDTAIRIESTAISGFKGDGFFCVIPPYELSIDAIAQAFDDHGLSYTLKKAVIENENAGCFASNHEGGEHFSDTAAKALCYLFIHCMEKQLKFFNPAQNQ